MPASRSLVALTALTLASCAHAPPLAERPDEVARAVIAEVEAVRGLKATAPIRVRLLDAAAFAEKLHGKELGDLGSASDDQAVWVAFGFTGPGTDADKTLKEVMDEQVAGFYAPSDKTLYIREGLDLTSSAGLDGRLLLRGILAHEIEHALQDQLFHAFDSKAEAPSAEGAQARLALVEGDAMLAMVAVIGHERGISMAQGLGNLATSVAAMSPEGLVRLSGHSQSLLSAPRLLRDELIFPYLDGLELTGAAYLAGGFPLVDRMFDRPPTTTAQVMHPEVYAEGRQAVPVPQPALPAGWKPITDGAMGELGTRAVLEGCLPRAQAVAAAAEWRGDHFAVATRPDGKLGLVWQVAFDSPKAAMAFAGALAAQRPCWDKLRGDGPGSIGDTVEVLPLGRSVVLARGVEPAAPAAILFPTAAPPTWRPLIASWQQPLAAAPASIPPLGAIALVPLQGALAEAQRGHLEANQYVDPGLGLTAEVPAGFTPNLGTQGVGLSIQKAGGGGGGFFSYIAAVPTPELRQQTFAGFIGGMNSTLGGGHHLEDEATEVPVELPLGKGFEKRWKVSDTQFEVRAAILPACGGRGAYLLGAVSADAETRALLGHWMSTFRIDPRAKAPVCEAAAK